MFVEGSADLTACYQNQVLGTISWLITWIKSAPLRFLNEMFHSLSLSLVGQTFKERLERNFMVRAEVGRQNSCSTFT